MSPLKVNLINFTPDAVEVLIYTKRTRLSLGEDARKAVASMTVEEKDKELRYMANTIPSSWEFVHYTFEILNVSRAFTHQFVRTRTGSYAQQTMRVLNVGQFDYVTGPTIANDPARRRLYDDVMKLIQAGYDNLIKMGASIEDARGVLPTNICTNIIASFSLRTLSEMAKSRTGKRTQNEYRDVIEKMLRCVIEVHPWAVHFLFPDRLERIKELEAFVEFVASNGKPPAIVDKTHYFKILDQLRKE
jgi:flavin-dependent thymidylate synthase